MAHHASINGTTSLERSDGDPSAAKTTEEPALQVLSRFHDHPLAFRQSRCYGHPEVVAVAQHDRSAPRPSPSSLITRTSAAARSCRRPRPAARAARPCLCSAPRWRPPSALRAATGLPATTAGCSPGMSPGQWRPSAICWLAGLVPISSTIPGTDCPPSASIVTTAAAPSCRNSTSISST